jgi:hypothetical protein
VLVRSGAVRRIVEHPKRPYGRTTNASLNTYEQGEIFFMTIIRSRAELLESPSEASASEDAGNMEAVNRLAQREMTRDQVHVRSMYLCSSQLCEADWCRFSGKGLHEIARKVVGESVLAGHDKHSLPVARFFKATVVERPEVPDPETGKPSYWVRAWFYWLKETNGARDLALNIDGGIYREVSVSWRYRGGRCSICDRPTHQCTHVPGEVYEGVRCYTWIDEIVDVLEGSLVYRGADRETAIAGERDAKETSAQVTLERMLAFEVGPILDETLLPTPATQEIAG